MTTIVTSQAHHTDVQQLITRFSPLNQIDYKYHAQLSTTMQLQTVKAGDTILRKNCSQKKSHFLVSGELEVRQSFDNRWSLLATDARCTQSLQNLLNERSNVRAISDCEVLVACNIEIDKYLNWGQDYAIFYLDEDELSVRDDELIDDNYQADWDSVFIRSRLAANLSNATIHKLMSQLEDVVVTAGEKIVKANSPGDYFYILKQGQAQVETSAHGPYQGKRFNLAAGDYFGDEALVAATIRNATVTMTTNGVLGRLNIDAFNELIKQHLVSTLPNDIRASADNVKIIDVRHALEYRHGHCAGSANVPISFLRQQLNSMQDSLLYVLAPANDSRAELATYLMRQAGFRAYQLPENQALPA